MSAISSYSNNSPVLSTDKVVGTNAAGSTKNFLFSDISTFILGNAPLTVTNTTSSAYTLALTDANTTIVYGGGTTSTFTVPLNATVAFPIGTVIQIMNASTGGGYTITIAVIGGVTIKPTGATIAQNAIKTLKKVATDTWFIY